MEALFPDGIHLTGLILPLLRLICVMAVSLIIAQALETFHWTAWIARLVSPLVRFARLSPLSGAAFSISFASPSAANALLAEGRAKGGMSRAELVLTNILNSTPAFLIHLPSLAAMAWSFLGAHACVYVGLVFSAALLRTGCAMAAGRLLLAPPAGVAAHSPSTREPTLAVMFRRFKERLTKICLFTIPIYCLIYFLQQAGAFARLETWLAVHLGGLAFLHPGSLGIVAVFVAAESNAAFAAAAALIAGGTLSPEQAVLALLAGNILSSPMRAFRHQLPSYSGFFSPPTALLLVGVNQSLRAASLALAAVVYYRVAI